MMSVQSMPPTLQLTNQASNENELEANLYETGQPASNNYASTKPGSTLTNMIASGAINHPRSSVEQPSRHTKSASKGGMMMSPYTGKSGQKNRQAHTYRMQTMTASKLHSTTNLLNSNAMQANKNRFELPLLSNRSASKPSLVQQRN